MPASPSPPQRERQASEEAAASADAAIFAPEEEEDDIAASAAPRVGVAGVSSEAAAVSEGERRRIENEVVC